MENTREYLTRSDIIMHHMSALSLLRSISGSISDDAADETDAPSDKKTSEFKVQEKNEKIAKMIEKAQTRRHVICKEAFSDDLYLLKYKIGDLYENEFSYGNLLIQSNSNFIDSFAPRKFSDQDIQIISKMRLLSPNKVLSLNQNIWLPLFEHSGEEFQYSALFAYAEDFYKKIRTTFTINARVEKDWKKRINEAFKNHYPKILISLTKYFSIKDEMKKVVISECSLDPIILANAYYYFDKIVSEGWVGKFNRKICSSLCVIFAAKLHDIKGEPLKELFEELENTFRLDKQEIIIYEFPCLLALKFNLLTPASILQWYYDKLDI